MSALCKVNTDINQHYAFKEDKIAGKNKNKRKKSARGTQKKRKYSLQTSREHVGDMTF